MSTLLTDNINEKTASNGVSLGGHAIFNTKEKVQSLAPVAGVLTIDYALGSMVIVDWNANITSTVVNNMPAGASLIIYMVQDVTGSRTVVWPASFTYIGGVEPTWSTGANQYDVVDVVTSDATTHEVTQRGANFS